MHEVRKLNNLFFLIELLITNLSYFYVQLFSQHLCKIMDHDFPEHYGEILLKLLDHSKEGRIYCQVWFNILNTILAQAVPTTQTNTARTILLPGISSDQLRDVVRCYATDQRSLSSQEV